MTKITIYAITGGALLALLVVLVFMEQRGHISFQNINKPQPEYTTNEILVRFKKDIPEDRIEEINKTLKTEVIKIMNLGNYQLYEIKIPKGATAPKLINEYRHFPEVEYFVPNSFVHINR